MFINICWKHLNAANKELWRRLRFILMTFKMQGLHLHIWIRMLYELLLSPTLVYLFINQEMGLVAFDANEVSSPRRLNLLLFQFWLHWNNERIYYTTEFLCIKATITSKLFAYVFFSWYYVTRCIYWKEMIISNISSTK